MFEALNKNKFIYLLYPVEIKPEGYKPTDTVYKALHYGVPISKNIDPVIVTDAEADVYDLDYLVANMQKYYKYNFDICVVKVPAELYKFEDHFLAGRTKPMIEGMKEEHYLPFMYDDKFFGRHYIPREAIESYYIHFPDCRRVINKNWVMIPKKYDMGIPTNQQLEAFRASGINLEDTKGNVEVTRYLKKKYEYHNFYPIWHNPPINEKLDRMTKEEINLRLMIEEKDEKRKNRWSIAVDGKEL